MTALTHGDRVMFQVYARAPVCVGVLGEVTNE